MGDTGRTTACLIGEGAAAQTPDDGLLQGDAGSSAHDSLGSESGGEDLAEGAGDVLGVADQNNETNQNIQQAHEGDQLFGDAADALDTADQDHGDQQSHGDAQNPAHHLNGLVAEAEEHIDRVGDGAGDRIDLAHVADTEGGQHRENGKQNSQPLPFGTKPLGDVVHGAAHPVAVFIPLAVVDGQGHLRVLDHHAHQGRQPQPEHRAVAAQGNGLRGTHNVAGAHRGRQGRGHRLQGRNGALAGLCLFEHFAGGVFHGVAKAAELDEAGPHRQQHAADHHAGQKDVQPGHRVQWACKEVQNCLHSFSSQFFLTGHSPYILCGHPFDTCPENKKRAAELQQLRMDRSKHLAPRSALSFGLRDSAFALHLRHS